MEGTISGVTIIADTTYPVFITIVHILKGISDVELLWHQVSLRTKRSLAVSEGGTAAAKVLAATVDTYYLNLYYSYHSCPL